MPKMENKITIYTTPTCGFCRQTKEFFKEHNIKFKEINVNEDEKAAEKMIEKSGQYGVPVIDVNGEIIVGFDQEALKKALKIKN